MEGVVRAVVMTGPGALEVRELAAPPEPPAGGAIVRPVVSGICGSDWDLYAGTLTHLRGKPVPFPMVLGHEPVAVVEAIGDDAAAAWGVAVGDRVVIGSTVACGRCTGCAGGAGAGVCRNGVTYSMIPLTEGAGLWGGMAERMVLLPGSCVVRVPATLSDLDAALFNPLANAVHWAVERGGVALGDDVLVLGCGQRGLCCVMAARAAGARRVIVTGLASDRHKLELAEALGATATVVAGADDIVGATMEVTDGAGVDVALDTVPGATQPLVDAIDVLRVRGTLVVAGLRNAPMPEFPIERFRAKQLQMVGVSATTPTAVRTAVDILAASDLPLERFHTHSFGLEEAERGIRLLGGCEPEERPIHVVVTPT